ncbi:hypothetical protein BD309DRAFT_949438 [Dichomitus squalens]|nr:hypothetical protein BD309DRAFT_949438 [Dichomitus squalens]
MICDAEGALALLSSCTYAYAPTLLPHGRRDRPVLERVPCYRICSAEHPAGVVHVQRFVGIRTESLLAASTELRGLWARTSR